MRVRENYRRREEREATNERERGKQKHRRTKGERTNNEINKHRQVEENTIKRDKNDLTPPVPQKPDFLSQITNVQL